MADHFTRLCQSLLDDKGKVSSIDLSHRLRSDDSIKLGLHHLYSLLKRCLHPIADDSPLLGFQSWTDQQIHSLVSLAYAIACASRSLTAEQPDPLIVAVVHKLLEFALCYLEKSNFNADDFTIQMISFSYGFDAMPNAFLSASLST